MGFIDGSDTLIGSILNKVDIVPIVPGTEANFVSAADWLAVLTAIKDGRAWLRGGKWLALEGGVGDPAPGLGDAGYLYIDQPSHTLHFNNGIVDIVLGSNDFTTTKHAQWTGDGATPVTIATYSPADLECGIVEFRVALKRTTGGAAVCTRITSGTYRRSGGSLPDFQQGSIAGSFGSFAPTITVAASGASVVLQVTAANGDVVASTTRSLVTSSA